MLINEPYSIFLDDLRTVNMVYPFNSENYPSFIEDFYICRTMEEAVSLISKKGYFPYYISFDNDLGEDKYNQPLKEGIHFAHWIVNSVLDGVYQLPHNFSFFVHSANSIAGPEIRILLNNFMDFQRNN